MDDRLYGDSLEGNNIVNLGLLDEVPSIDYFFPLGAILWRYANTKEEYILEEGDDEDILPEPPDGKKLELIDWKRNSFSIYNDSE